MPRQCRNVPCIPLATTMAEASGSTVFAARRENTAATPAGAIVGTITIGHHIILFPKLAPSCSVKISAAVITAPAAASPAMPRSKRPVRMFSTHPRRQLRGAGFCCSASPVPSAGQELLRLLPDTGLQHSPGVLVTADERFGRVGICCLVAWGGIGGTSGSVCTSSTVGRSAASAFSHAGPISSAWWISIAWSPRLAANPA